MNFPKRQNAAGSIKAAIAVSAILTPPDDEIEGRLKRRGWVIHGRTTSIQRALTEIKAGKASVLILEDSSELPIQVMLRQLNASSLGILTPAIGLCTQENNKETTCFGTIGMPSVVEGPVSPLNFIESFEFLVKKWSSSNLTPLVGVRSLFAAGRFQDGIKILSSLAQSDETQLAIVSGVCLSVFFKKQSQRTSEKILLSLLERSKKNMGVIFALVDLYYEAAMPGYALRLLNNASTMYAKPKTILLDLLQSNLLLNDVEEMIKILKKMRKEKYLPNMVNDFLPRLLIAAGYRAEFEAMLSRDQTGKIEHLTSWGLSVPDENKAAS